MWEGESGWGTHVNPWLNHVNVWQKPLQYCKAISVQLIKINEKKKKNLTQTKTTMSPLQKCLFRSSKAEKGLLQGQPRRTGDLFSIF